MTIYIFYDINHSGFPLYNPPELGSIRLFPINPEQFFRTDVMRLFPALLTESFYNVVFTVHQENKIHSFHNNSASKQLVLTSQCSNKDTQKRQHTAIALFLRTPNTENSYDNSIHFIADQRSRPSDHRHRG